jgi:hypothetical protein
MMRVAAMNQRSDNPTTMAIEFGNRLPTQTREGSLWQPPGGDDSAGGFGTGDGDEVMWRPADRVE